MTQADPGARGAPMSLPATLAFAAVQVPVGALALAVAVHLPRYFAAHLGLSLSLVGFAFFAVRFIDIPLDPLLGLAMDRTKTRFGRYRVWTLLGAPVLMAALYMLIHPPDGVGSGYLMGWLLLMYVGFSILLLSNLAWAATLAPSYEHRSRLFGVVTALGVAGAVIVLVIPVVMQKLGYSDPEGVQAMVWFIIGSTPICALLVVWRTPEWITRDHGHPRFALRDYAALLARPNVVRLIAADLCVNLGPGWMAAVYLFFFKDSRGFNTTQANLLLMIYIAAGFLGAPATAWLANRISKHRALMVNTTVYSLMLLTLVVLPKGNFLAAVPTMFICGAMAAGFLVMIRALAGDIGDEIRLETGREWMGLMYALTNATTKLAAGAAIILTFNVLAAVGYNAHEGSVNTPQAILGLELAYLIGPIAFVMLGGACFLGYKLTAHRHGEIRREIDAQDAAYSEAAVLEGLTGEPAGVVLRPR